MELIFMNIYRIDILLILVENYWTTLTLINFNLIIQNKSCSKEVINDYKLQCFNCNIIWWWT